MPEPEYNVGWQVSALLKDAQVSLKIGDNGWVFTAETARKVAAALCDSANRIQPKTELH
jgi:hypothetical protein